ncbi:O-antigen ligase family protein [Bradyrhizobium sp. CB82]|uniref:O-antigen ligase family protein n=1 Tax=Bradyrhizobium sp. CB82 TaxID=3039159 RepID=UPI0024B078B8|nr:O-antigen ligase family protein [Bradyrhizobium sp. CB82]WFU37365.1 O-antigen ligase family protein [Bradyrhizobium sp. CB82]
MFLPMLTSLALKLNAATSRFATEASLACTTWSGPELARAGALRSRNIDVAVLGLAAVLPWSTSATSIFGIAIFFLIWPTIKTERLVAALSQPAGALPIALVVLAAIGTAWATGVPCSERLGALDKMIKLLLLPLLLLHFRYSRRATWIFAAFVGSNVILLGYSFLAYAVPSMAIVEKVGYAGVPVRNYIDQSQGFAFVATALAGLAFEAASRKDRYSAAALGATASLFFVNLAFVNVARTAFFYIPIMLVLLTVRYVNRRQVVAGLIGAAIICGGLWQISPNLHRKVSTIFAELAVQPDAPIGENEPSAAMRLEFWRKSLRFFEMAPVMGHGTGSIRGLFQQDAIGQAGVSAVIVRNPHNQTLAAAVQWGSIGIIILWVMWIAHLRLFCISAPVAWIGMLATVQNIASSVFNSHLMDTYEGWLYVLAVGVAGGEVLRIQSNTAIASKGAHQEACI